MNSKADYLDEFSENELRKFLANQNDTLENIAESSKLSNSVWFYRFIIHFLTNIEFEEKEAQKHYEKILEHRILISEKLGRDIGLRVAAMDYFYNVIKILKNPRIIEIGLFEEILKTAKEDTKTGCLNPGFFTEMTEKEIKRSERHNQNLSLLLMDIDNFKALNDEYGHLFGDKVLKEFSLIIKDSVRREDLIGRFGGDEFVILLPQTGRVGARFLAERIKENLSRFLTGSNHLNKKVEITFSAGIATYPFDATDYEGLIKTADKALYKSKFLGKNRIYDYLQEEYSESQAETDRRRFTRFSMGMNAEADMLNPLENISVKGRIINISPSGMLMECNCILDDDILKKELELRIGGQQKKGFTVKAKVARLTMENEQLKFYLGLKFHEVMDRNQWQKFEEYGGLMPL